MLPSSALFTADSLPLCNMLPINVLNINYLVRHFIQSVTFEGSAVNLTANIGLGWKCLILTKTRESGRYRKRERKIQEREEEMAIDEEQRLRI